jgi:putative SOS response-associated peptidase YedK
MCSNFISTRPNRIADHFGVTVKERNYKAEIYPGFMSPILQLASGDPSGARLEAILACFGMVPHWAELKLAKHTYNARSETVAQKPTFRNAWKKKQFCLIPVDAFFEPKYESGKAVRWKINHRSTRPLALAGIWETRRDGPDGGELHSFSMLTINADEHPLMRQFHKPGDEKRMVVILEPQQYHAWLHASIQDAPDFLQPYPAEQLTAVASPKPPGSGKKTSLLDAA